MKFKKGDMVKVKVTPELAAKMPYYFADATVLKGKVYCCMKSSKGPSYRIDFSELVQIQVPAELVSELRPQDSSDN